MQPADGPADPRQCAQIPVGLPMEFMVMTDPTAALAGYAAAACYAAGGATDGHFPFVAIQRLAGISDTAIKDMIEAGFWHDEHHRCAECPAPRGGHGYIHGFLRDNRSAETQRTLVSKRSAAGQAGADKRWAAARAKKEKERQRQIAKGEAQPERPEVERLCDYLANFIQKNSINGKRPTVTESWRTQCRLMLDNDRYTVEQIREVIAWTQRHSFWAPNIRSMPKLREKFQQMAGLMRNGDARGPARGQPVGALNFEGSDEAFAQQFGPAPTTEGGTPNG